MSLPELISKHKAHLLHVTDAYHGLKEKYALLDPMIFDTTLAQKHKNRGFEVLRQSLFFALWWTSSISFVKRTPKRTPKENLNAESA